MPKIEAEISVHGGNGASDDLVAINGADGSVSDEVMTPITSLTKIDQRSNTSLIGVRFRDGIILGCDKLSTANNGAIISRIVNKMTNIGPIYCICSGGAGLINALVTASRNEYNARLGTDDAIPNDIEAIGDLLLRNITRYAVDTNTHISLVNARFILGGRRDENRTSIRLVSPPRLDIDGKDDYLVGGSGAQHMLPYVGANWRSDMLEAEALVFVRNALEIGIHSDPFSGGAHVRTITIRDHQPDPPLVVELESITLTNEIVSALTPLNFGWILEMIASVQKSGPAVASEILLTLWDRNVPENNLGEIVLGRDPQIALDLNTEGADMIGRAIEKFEREFAHSSTDILQFIVYGFQAADLQAEERKRFYFSRYNSFVNSVDAYNKWKARMVELSNKQKQMLSQQKTSSDAKSAKNQQKTTSDV